MVDDQWCILRTAGPSTLGVAASLAAAGYYVWTPMEVKSRRFPRSKVRREVQFPMMPTYVFARADCLPDLLALAADPLSDHPAFSVFKYSGRFPLISGRSLEPLRVAERRRKPAKLRPVFEKGDRVRMEEGAYAGLSGIVELSKGGEYALICFPGSNAVFKVSSLLLLPDLVEEQKPNGTAAQAALAS